VAGFGGKNTHMGFTAKERLGRAKEMPTL